MALPTYNFVVSSPLPNTRVDNKIKSGRRKWFEKKNINYNNTNINFSGFLVLSLLNSFF